MKNIFIFLIIFSIVLVSRIPFLDAGYGIEQDGWRVAAAARHLAIWGDYKASRFPGFPIVEFTYSLVWKGGAVAMNLLTALTSAIAAGIFSLIAKRYGCQDSFLLALTFAFTPVVFIYSTATMDYLWAMMFVMLSWYAGLKEKPIIAGLFLGIATGCRITTILLILPFTILFLEQQNSRLRYVGIMKFWIAAGVGSICAYLPVFFSYGTNFITEYRRDSPPPIFTIVRFITNDVWGLVGSFAVLVAIPFILKNHKKNINSSIPRTVSINHRKIWIAVLTLVAVGFALHPMKGTYLIPAIPFLLLLFARYLTRVQFISICTLIMLSSFIISFDSGDRPWSSKPSTFSTLLNIGRRVISVDILGSIFSDHSKRIQRMDYIRRVISQADTLQKPSVIIAGSWLPCIIIATPYALPESEHEDYTLCRNNVEFVGLVNHKMLNQMHQRGVTVLYLPSVDEFNKRVNGIDLKKEGAQELVLLSNLPIDRTMHL
jgi:hypothetical protein